MLCHVIGHIHTAFNFSFPGIISVNSRRTPFTANGENEILDLEGDLYLGGLPDSRGVLVLPTELWTAILNYGYVGCVRDLFIDGRSKDIRQIAQSQNMTGIRSSCTKATGKQCDSNPCKNSGACKEGWNRYVCDCTGSGFWGSTCERGEAVPFYMIVFFFLCCRERRSFKIFFFTATAEVLCLSCVVTVCLIRFLTHKVDLRC